MAVTHSFFVFKLLDTVAQHFQLSDQCERDIIGAFVLLFHPSRRRHRAPSAAHVNYGQGLERRRSSCPTSLLQAERQRQAALQPYLVASPKRGIIGNSKYAVRLRRQVIRPRATRPGASVHAPRILPISQMLLARAQQLLCLCSKQHAAHAVAATLFSGNFHPDLSRH